MEASLDGSFLNFHAGKGCQQLSDGAGAKPLHDTFLFNRIGITGDFKTQ
jgi:hypothetical protein